MGRERERGVKQKVQIKASATSKRKLTIVQLLSSNFIFRKSLPPLTSARLPHCVPFNLTPSDADVSAISMSPFFSEALRGILRKISTSDVLCCHFNSSVSRRERYARRSAFPIRDRATRDESNAIASSFFSRSYSSSDGGVVGIFLFCFFFYNVECDLLFLFFSSLMMCVFFPKTSEKIAAGDFFISLSLSLSCPGNKRD